MPLRLVWIFLRMKPKVRFAFVVTFSICWFQFRSISSPRYFAWSTASKTWPCRTYCVWRGFRAREICRTWHLLGLKCISHVFSHFSSFWRSCCRVWESSLLVTVKYTAVSPAKSLTCEFMFSGRSFMYWTNKICPRTEPWSTPEVARISDDFSSFKATLCERSSKNALIQLRSLKKNSFEVWFYTYLYTPPWGQNFYFNINLLSLWSFAVSFFH